MITILSTSYLDQTQAIGLNTILEYSGVTAVVIGCLTVEFDSKQPSIGFTSKGPEATFESKQPSMTFRGRCDVN